MNDIFKQVTFDYKAIYFGVSAGVIFAFLLLMSFTCRETRTHPLSKSGPLSVHLKSGKVYAEHYDHAIGTLSGVYKLETQSVINRQTNIYTVDYTEFEIRSGKTVCGYVSTQGRGKLNFNSGFDSLYLYTHLHTRIHMISNCSDSYMLVTVALPNYEIVFRHNGEPQMTDLELVWDDQGGVRLLTNTSNGYIRPKYKNTLINFGAKSYVLHKDYMTEVR